MGSPRGWKWMRVAWFLNIITGCWDAWSSNVLSSVPAVNWTSRIPKWTKWFTVPTSMCWFIVRCTNDKGTFQCLLPARTWKHTQSPHLCWCCSEWGLWRDQEDYVRTWGWGPLLTGVTFSEGEQPELMHLCIFAMGGITTLLYQASNLAHSDRVTESSLGSFPAVKSSFASDGYLMNMGVDLRISCTDVTGSPSACTYQVLSIKGIESSTPLVRKLSCHKARCVISLSSDSKQKVPLWYCISF